VSDLAPLAGLSNLKSLHCSETEVSDFAPLARLSNLQSLNGSGSRVRPVEDDVLDVVRKYCKDNDRTYGPDIVLNSSEYGEEANNLINAAADRIGLAREEAYRGLPYATYFVPERIFNFPTLILIILAKRIFGLEKQRPPLTALGFARLLADLKHRTAKP
jgi:Leucine-rich repeat (LRR) protein